MDFAATAELCAPDIHVQTLRSIAAVESSFNPFAIGVVGGQLQRQPRSFAEAVATARMLETEGLDYSVGLIQVNRKNFARYGLTLQKAFDICTNLRVGAAILRDCLERAGDRPSALGDALSCYYSGNFKTGYRHGYVAKVLDAGGAHAAPIPVRARSGHAPASGKSRLDRERTPEPLFVSVAIPPVNSAASSGTESQPPKARDTALLF
jgi:type IV secretion system protein VirB1